MVTVAAKISIYQLLLLLHTSITELSVLSHAHLCRRFCFLFFVFCFFLRLRVAQKTCTSFNMYSVYFQAQLHIAKTTSPSHPQKKQSFSLRHNKALAYIPSARSSLLLLQHMASKAREGRQPVRQTSSLPGPRTTDGPVGHVSRGEQKAQPASQQSPGPASGCESPIEQRSRDRVPRNNGVEADRGFCRMPRGNDNIHLVLGSTNTINQIMLCCLFSCFV